MRSPEIPDTGLLEGSITPRQPRSRRTGLVAATAAVALLAAACGAAEDATDTASGGSADAAGETSGPVLDAALFSGEAMTVSGDAFDLGSLAEKDLVLWFWAPW